MNMTEIVLAQGRGMAADKGLNFLSVELAAAAADLHRLLHRRPGGDQPASRSTWSKARARSSPAT
jgi:hypothetical protein